MATHPHRHTSVLAIIERGTRIRCVVDSEDSFFWISPLIDIGTEVEERFEVAAVARFDAGQMEADRIAVEIGLEMDLGREASQDNTPETICIPSFLQTAG